MPPTFKALLSRHFFKNRREQRLVRVSIATREPVPLDHARPSVAQLPDPIIRRILTFLHDIRREDLQTIASLSSSLYEQVRCVQHSYVHCDLDKNEHVLDRLHLIGRLGQFPAIRTLKVSGRKCEKGQEESNEILARLAVVMPAMTGLRDLAWEVGCTGPDDRKRATVMPLSTSILAALPLGLRLRTSVFYNESTFLHRLASSQSLYTLSVEVTFVDEQDCVETMRALKTVLLSCPNLTRLPMIDVWSKEVRTAALATASDLVHLSKSLPHLEHLALDITRDDETQEWLYAVLDAIAAFPCLRTVELWFPLDMKPPAPSPPFTASSARHLFRYLRERNENMPRATLHSGSTLPPIKGCFESLIDLGPSWAMHNSVDFVCDIVYDSESPDGGLNVWCRDLSKHMNAQLYSLSQRAGRELLDPQKLDADGLHLRVALDGPLDAMGVLEGRGAETLAQDSTREARTEHGATEDGCRALGARVETIGRI
ncbi:hypothetical protein QQZ08_010107 [Neonectria magnoliae]|uniref:F-box domain-containing protein n=1 Tax=Neonectria magnoliae TaxID=2732573 RepID=A0ABR1HIT2_9HYPO